MSKIFKYVDAQFKKKVPSLWSIYIISTLKCIKLFFFCRHLISLYLWYYFFLIQNTTQHYRETRCNHGLSSMSPIVLWYNIQVLSRIKCSFRFHQISRSNFVLCVECIYFLQTCCRHFYSYLINKYVNDTSFHCFRGERPYVLNVKMLFFKW